MLKPTADGSHTTSAVSLKKSETKRSCSRSCEQMKEIVSQRKGKSRFFFFLTSEWFQFSNTFQNSWSPLTRIMVVNSSRRTVMVHLLKLNWSTSLGLKWEVFLARGKQLSAAASSWVDSSVTKKRIALRKLDFPSEPWQGNWKKYSIYSVVNNRYII